MLYIIYMYIKYYVYLIHFYCITNYIIFYTYKYIFFYMCCINIIIRIKERL
jgi:hypothetical protein